MLAAAYCQSLEPGAGISRGMVGLDQATHQWRGRGRAEVVGEFRRGGSEGRGGTYEYGAMAPLKS